MVPSEESPKPPEDDTETEKDGVSSEAGRKKAEKAPVGKIKMGFGVLGKRPASAGGISMKIKPQVCCTMYSVVDNSVWAKFGIITM